MIYPAWDDAVCPTATVDPDAPIIITSDVTPEWTVLCLWQGLTLLDVLQYRGAPGRWTIVPSEE